MNSYKFLGLSSFLVCIKFSKEGKILKKVKVFFTVNSATGKVTFSAINEIENNEIAATLTDMLLNWEMRIKEAAIQSLLINEVGAEQAKNIKVKLITEDK